MRRRIVHVADIRINEQSGMGRVAFHWRRAFQRAGYEFLHIGAEEVGRRLHPTIFRWRAYRHFKRLSRPGDVLLVHEPESGTFVRRGFPAIVFSHGLERRGAEVLGPIDEVSSTVRRLRRLVTAPLWAARERSCDYGLTNATGALLINSEDAEFARSRYAIGAERCFVFENGVYPREGRPSSSGGLCRALFLGTWIDRKGINTLARAAEVLEESGVKLEWCLAGTGASKSEVLQRWPKSLTSRTEVISRFPQTEEERLFSNCAIFVLPSLFEGQPLSLLQAMAAGLCCITSACCGQLDVISHTQNGLLHKPGDADALAYEISRAVRDHHLRAALGLAAKASMADRTWEAVSSRVVSCVERWLSIQRNEEVS